MLANASHEHGVTHGDAMALTAAHDESQRAIAELTATVQMLEHQAVQNQAIVEEAAERKRALGVFDRIDLNGNGVLSKAEVMHAMQTDRAVAQELGPGMLQRMAADPNGELHRERFVKRLALLR